MFNLNICEGLGAKICSYFGPKSPKTNQALSDIKTGSWFICADRHVDFCDSFYFMKTDPVIGGV